MATKKSRRQVPGQQQLPLDTLSWVPEGRRLVVVDLENLAGGSNAPLAVVEGVVAEFRRLVDMTVHDVAVWACGPTLARRVAGIMPNIVLGRGIDGADQRLLEYIEPALVCGHYASVVLGSGDGRAFTHVVTHLRGLGVATDVVARPEAMAGSLRAVARSYTPLSFAVAA